MIQLENVGQDNENGDDMILSEEEVKWLRSLDWSEGVPKYEEQADIVLEQCSFKSSNVFLWRKDTDEYGWFDGADFRARVLGETNRKPHGVKARWTLLPWAGTEIVLQTMAHGAEKYGPDNWRGNIDRKEYLSAAARHLIAALMGEDIDPDSGLPHLAHVGANVAMILEEHGK